MTISELVRAQVMAEAPQLGARQIMVYVDAQIDAMDNTELLDRISDAISSQVNTLEKRKTFFCHPESDAEV